MSKQITILLAISIMMLVVNSVSANSLDKKQPFGGRWLETRKTIGNTWNQLSDTIVTPWSEATVAQKVEKSLAYTTIAVVGVAALTVAGAALGAWTAECLLGSAITELPTVTVAGALDGAYESSAAVRVYEGAAIRVYSSAATIRDAGEVSRLLALRQQEAAAEIALNAAESELDRSALTVVADYMSAAVDEEETATGNVAMNRPARTSVRRPQQITTREENLADYTQTRNEILTDRVNSNRLHNIENRIKGAVSGGAAGFVLGMLLFSTDGDRDL